MWTPRYLQMKDYPAWSHVESIWSKWVFKASDMKDLAFGGVSVHILHFSHFQG